VSSFVDGMAIASGAIVVITGAAVIVGGVRARWRTTVGSRRRLTRALNKLAAGMPAGNLEDLLGPCAIRRWAAVDVNSSAGNCQRPPGRLRQQVYLTKHAIVDAFVEPELDTVTAFGITVSDRRFMPSIDRLTFGTFAGIRLGRSSFAQLTALRGSDQNEGVYWWHGARDAGYAEAYWGANPGGYQSYVLGWIGSGTGHLSYDQVPPLPQLGLATGKFAAPPNPAETDRLAGHAPERYDPQAWKWFRASTTINTLQVLGPGWLAVDSWTRPGVDGDITRLLRDPPRTFEDRVRTWYRATVNRRTW
jgi:hypothetical protein